MEAHSPPSVLSVRGMHVLLVEDDDILRNTIAAILRARGFQVTEVGSADDAIPMLKTTDPDFVFSDIEMPGTMNGIGLGHWVHANRPYMAFALTTGRNVDREPHPFTVLPKPYRIATLLEIMQATQSSH